MADQFPENVILTEVGLRDGFQFEKRVGPTAMKLEIIADLIAAGLRSIQVTSFVDPNVIPQTADAEALVARLPARANVDFNALVLNVKGVERAVASGLKSLEISMSASDSHSRKNAGMDVKTALSQCQKMVRMAKARGVKVRAGIQCAFGCVYAGVIPKAKICGIVETFMAEGVDSLFLADTTGMADPVSIAGMLEKILPVMQGLEMGLHLHDTRGLGLVNAMTALRYGVRRFDSSLAGMGGCPFVPEAAGNIATEDMVNFMHCMKIQTGIDIQKLAACSIRLEAFFGKRFPGRMHRLTDGDR